jgi:integration host factor subunit beta
MTKQSLTVELARVLETSHQEAEQILDAVLRAIVRALQRGEAVEIRRFGSFRLRRRAARLGRNPRTGQSVEVPARPVAYFRPSKELLQLLASIPDPADQQPGSVMPQEAGR